MTYHLLVFSYRDRKAAKIENRPESAMMVVRGERVDGVWRRVGRCRHSLPWRPKSGHLKHFKVRHLALASHFHHDHGLGFCF
jgi:hypothetical protein